MNTTAELEQQLLGLPPADRARLVLKAWESLVDDLEVASDPTIDTEGISIAMERDAELERSTVTPMDDAEFRRRTGDDE